MEMAWQKRNRLSEKRAKGALQATNEAGGTVRNLYITFLLLGVYIGIIIASTTDRQLLLISPVILPLLNVQLPILGFYIFVPWLFLLVHFDLLLQLFLMSDKLRVFAQASAALPAEKAESLRKQLINFPVVQMLASPQYDWLIQWLLALTVWITVLILPLGLLLWAQIRFLPYHNASITWGQRTTVLLDALMLLLFWPRLVFGQGALGWWIRCLAFWRRGQSFVKRGTGLVLGAVVLITLMLSLLVATVPKELWETWLLAQVPTSWKSPFDRSQRPAVFHPTFLLLEGEHKMLSRNLDLHEQLLIANELPADVQHALRKRTAQQQEQALQKVQGLNLQHRDLRYANLTNSLLPEADLREAQLQGAVLKWAQLQGADLREAQLQGAVLELTQLQGADLRGAQLQNANLEWAQLQGVDLELTQLQGADLASTQLQGANLRGANFQGADLWEAQLQGADLRGAQLQGADLEFTQLQGANLRGANFQGADLEFTQLQGADLRGAQLQGADLREAQLQGADLREAQLQSAILKANFQGADLRGAQLQGADLRKAQLQGAILEANFQGADLRGAQLQGADLRGASIGGALFENARLDLADLRYLDLSAIDQKKYKTLQIKLEKSINNSQIREDAIERLRKAINRPGALNRIASATQCLSDIPKFLPGCLTKEEIFNYFEAHADYLVKQVACSTINTAQSIFRHTLELSRDYYPKDETNRLAATRLAATLLTADCEPVKTARGELSNEDKQELEKLARESW